jgi:hypothetical protein
VDGDCFTTTRSVPWPARPRGGTFRVDGCAKNTKCNRSMEATRTHHEKRTVSTMRRRRSSTEPRSPVPRWHKYDMMSMCTAVAAALMPPLNTDIVLPTTAASRRPARSSRPHKARTGTGKTFESRYRRKTPSNAPKAAGHHPRTQRTINARYLRRPPAGRSAQRTGADGRWT